MSDKPFALPPGIRIRGGTFHYRFKHGGQEYAETTGLEATKPNLTSAVRQMSEARALVESGHADQLRLVPKPFSDAAQEFLTWAEGEYQTRSTVRRLRVSSTSLCEFFANLPFHSITPGQIEDYKTWRRDAGIKEITLRHDLHALSKLYQYAALHRWSQANHVENVGIPSDKDAVRQHVLSPDEESAYFETAPRTLYDAARLILLTGMRPEEVLSLSCDDVDLQRETVFVRRGKSKAARRILALVPEALQILAPRVVKGFRYVFPSQDGKGAMRQINSAHDRHLEAYNNPRKGPRPALQLQFVPYDLRHTFATRMAEANCPPAVLAAILGHADLRTLHRYVHVRQSAQEDAMRRYALSAFCPLPTGKHGDKGGKTGQSGDTAEGRA